MSGMLLMGCGPGNGASFVGALDAYSSNLPLALSVTNRLLASFTGYAYNARRSSDSATMDVAFNADGTVNTTALLAWTGSNSAFITKVYNQGSGGSGLDAAQSTAANQPRIVNAGVLDDGMRMNNSLFLDVPSSAASVYTDGTNVQVGIKAAFDSGAILGRTFSFNSDAFGAYLQYAGVLYWDAPFPSGRLFGAQPAGYNTGYHTTSLERAASTSNVRVDGTVALTGSVASSITGTSVLRIGTLSSGASGMQGNLRTFCLWKDCTNPAARAAAIP